MKIFISGAIAGTSDYKERFAKAEQHLKDLGHEVINPVKLTESLPEDTPWETYMEITIAALKTCEAIYMTKGFKKSIGANIEHAFACKMDLCLMYEEEDNAD